jgi:SAM-dependent methyltransferase
MPQVAEAARGRGDDIGMTKAKMEDELRRLAPFHHAVDLPHGLRTYVPEASRQERERTRLRSLIEHGWPSLLAACGGSLRGLRVLDVACNCGGFSVAAAQSGADQVVGFDVEPHYVEQANFIKNALGLDNVNFHVMGLDDLDFKIHGSFDVAFCFGILYHLEDPVRGLKKIADVTDKLIVVDTTLMRVPYINSLLRQPLWHMRVVPAVDEGAKNISTSRWRKRAHCQFSPNARAVKDLLRYVGFGDVEQLRPKAKNLERRYYKGTRATFIARRREDD